MSDLETFLKPQEVADRLRVALSTVYAWGNRGTIPAVKLGRCMRFSEHAISEYVKKAVEVGYGKAA